MYRNKSSIEWFIFQNKPQESDPLLSTAVWVQGTITNMFTNTVLVIPHGMLFNGSKIGGQACNVSTDYGLKSFMQLPRRQGKAKV